MALSISHHKIILNKYLCKKIESLLFLCVWRFEYRRRRLNSNYRVAKIILDMMEENDIFFVGGGDSIYLAKSVHKKYSTKFVWVIHSVLTDLTTTFSTLFPCTHLHIFWRTPFLNGWPISQPKHKKQHSNFVFTKK